MKKITPIEADVLLEKYYEGQTSTAEEKQLHAFLSKDLLPERFKADQAVFGYFAGQKQNKRARILPVWKWGSAAAVFLGLAIVTAERIYANQTNYAYINGQKYTNNEVVRQQAMASLQNISSPCNEMQSQLQVFTEN